MKNLRNLRNWLTAVSLGIVLAWTVIGSTKAPAQTYSVIHNFSGADGQSPTAGVSLRGGILYGTTLQGGNGNGTVYQTTHAGSNWVTNPISLLPVGMLPYATVVFGPDGHPYGTAFRGGSSNNGIVFDLIPPFSICRTVNCFWKENVIYEFQGAPDAAQPTGGLIWDQEGNIYGTTVYGGTHGAGAVYELMKSGSSWAEKVIWSFSGGADGLRPNAEVVMDTQGNLFGTTNGGGLYNQGVVFKLTPSGDQWQETVVYSFKNQDDGSVPLAGLIFDSSGNLFGAASEGGSGVGGTVFELIPSGNSYTFKLLHSFSGQAGFFCGPRASLTLDTSGNLYGTTDCSGAHGQGNVFKLTKNGTDWIYGSLYDFTGGADGDQPQSTVTIDGQGNLYGTTTGGGRGYGVLWMITP